MTMTLRLDTTGLRALIAENQTFAVEIQQAVLNNIKNDNIQEAVLSRVNGCLDKMAPKESYWGNTRVIKDERIREVIHKAVELEVKESLERIIENTVQSATDAVDTRIRREVKRLAKEVLLETLTAEDAKVILMQKLI